MAHFSFSLLLSASLLCAGQLSAQTVAFTRDADVWVADIDPKKPAKRLVAGTDPAISPDGTKVAYTHNDEGGGRKIAVTDVATGDFQVLEGIPGDNSYLPIWSPDGKYLYFNHFLQSDWVLARVKADGTGFTMYKDLPRAPGSYGWSPNGIELLCHDLDNFFILAFEGSKVRLREVPLSERNIGLSTPSRLVVSPDGKRALFERSMDEEMGPDDEGPPSAVWLLELETGKIKRATKAPYNAAYPSWLPDGSGFVFSSYDQKRGEASVYRAGLNGVVEPLINNASTPTVSRSR